MTTFKVLTYNMLHGFGASRLLRGRSSALGTTWPQERVLRAVDVVRRLRPDVACLQEVDATLHTELCRVLGEDYICAAEMRNEELAPRDGCAAFVRASRFEVVQTSQFHLRDALERHCGDLENAKGGGGMSAALWRELHEKLNIGLVMRLRLRPEEVATKVATVTETQATDEEATSSSRTNIAAHDEICVSTTHLYWDPGYPDLKLLQAFLLAREVGNFAKDLPTVLAGDFNSTPLVEGGGSLSGVYQLLRRGVVQATHPHHPVTLRRGSGILKGVTAVDVPQLLTDTPKYQSAYADATGMEGPITNSSSNFQGCLDYIFYHGGRGDGAGLDNGDNDERPGSGRLRLLGVEPLPTPEDLRPHMPLPSAQYPSDHLPLMAEFELLQR
eukprot:TRINITY_DN67673_c0_g1_i1.p1 TRINITY_DN67673_c0_g1~~TRINITY_DN67673_c0_g1_i1.p1  ORF type:complete len:386 (+),score=63.72 TRINITY_DN67673_c0_g1_i1:154-1311(+)